ncbi:MAG: hypothetical protein U5S82_08240 [Gammaproteobacteria bacterium]|nr:hypothetical protein [Gammaproteobacteria bacterium]
MHLPYILGACLLAGCGGGPEEAPPWEVERLADGGIEALGLRPGESTMGEALARFGRRVEAALFESRDGELTVEAHYGSVRVAAIAGRLFLSLDLEPGTLEALKQASPNHMPQPSGGRRHELDAAFGDVLLDETIRVVSFAPQATVTEETLAARFGEPAERVTAADDSRHLLYPALGTDVLVEPEGNVIIQYVHPRDFDWLRRRQDLPAGP